MKTTIFGVTGLSLLSLFASLPPALLAHEGHDHGDRRSRYSEREDAGRSAPEREDDWGEDEDVYKDEEESGRPFSRRYPPPEEERSSPRERGGRPW